MYWDIALFFVFFDLTMVAMETGHFLKMLNDASLSCDDKCVKWSCGNTGVMCKSIIKVMDILQAQRLQEEGVDLGFEIEKDETFNADEDGRSSKNGLQFLIEYNKKYVATVKLVLLLYITSQLPGFARVTYYASIPCHMCPFHNFHYLQLYPPPVKQYADDAIQRRARTSLPPSPPSLPSLPPSLTPPLDWTAVL